MQPEKLEKLQSIICFSEDKIVPSPSTMIYVLESEADMGDIASLYRILLSHLSSDVEQTNLEDL